MSKGFKELTKDAYFDEYVFKEEKNNYEKALNYALDIRKFEIELYWKRATYFWAFIAIIFVGYFGLTNTELKQNDIYYFLVGCIGIIFSLGWWKVNKGSKTWQDNWEKQVDILEEKAIGPLYKTLIIKQDTKKFYSVSKINLELSKFVTVIWILITTIHAYLFLTKNEAFLELVSLIFSSNPIYIVIACMIKVALAEFTIQGIPELLLFITILSIAVVFGYSIVNKAINSTFVSDKNDKEITKYVIYRRNDFKNNQE